MTTKKETTKEGTVKKSVPKEKKEILYELVKDSGVNEVKMTGLLIRSGLYNQYLEEKKKWGTIIVEPTITKSEFDKIIGE